MNDHSFMATLCSFDINKQLPLLQLSRLKVNRVCSLGSFHEKPRDMNGLSDIFLLIWTWILINVSLKPSELRTRFTLI